jgi:hypothetical protein
LSALASSFHTIRTKYLESERERLAAPREVLGRGGQDGRMLGAVAFLDSIRGPASSSWWA